MGVMPASWVSCSRSRTFRRRWSQALVDICDFSLREPGGRTTRSDRYRVNLFVHLTEHGTWNPETPLPPDALCDSAFTRTVLSAQGEVLDVAHSMSAAKPDPGLTPSPTPSGCGTGTAPSPAVTGPPAGTTSTTAWTGTSAAKPQSPTAACSAAGTTPGSTPTDGPSASTNTRNQSSGGPTAPPTRTNPNDHKLNSLHPKPTSAADTLANRRLQRRRHHAAAERAEPIHRNVVRGASRWLSWPGQSHLPGPRRVERSAAPATGHSPQRAAWSPQRCDEPSLGGTLPARAEMEAWIYGPRDAAGNTPG